MSSDMNQPTLPFSRKAYTYAIAIGVIGNAFAISFGWSAIYVGKNDLLTEIGNMLLSVFSGLLFQAPYLLMVVPIVWLIYYLPAVWGLNLANKKHWQSQRAAAIFGMIYGLPATLFGYAFAEMSAMHFQVIAVLLSLIVGIFAGVTFRKFALQELEMNKQTLRSA